MKTKQLVELLSSNGDTDALKDKNKPGPLLWVSTLARMRTHTQEKN